LALRMRAAALPAQPPARAVSGLPRLGLLFGDPPPGDPALHEGLNVVAADGPAILAGIEAGDGVAAVNGRPVETVQQFDDAVRAARAAGRRDVALLVVRESLRIYVAVRLDEVASEPARAAPPR